MSVKVTENKVTAWVHLMRASQHVHCAIECALKEGGYPGLEWYDVLLELKRTSPGGLRPTTLEEKLLIKQYNLSRQLARMVESGVIEKRPCPEDGRGTFFFLTDKGLAQQQAMWPIYRETLNDVFGSKVSSADADMLVSALQSVKPK